MSLEALFPALIRTTYQETSPRDKGYNCIAYAAGVADAFWEPDPMEISYWPEGIPRQNTLRVWVRVFESLGYAVCSDGSLEPGCEKVAIYVLEGEPQHVARQFPNGCWRSKIGVLEDIEHDLQGLVGSRYGSVAQFMRRRLL